MKGLRKIAKWLVLIYVLGATLLPAAQANTQSEQRKVKKEIKQLSGQIGKTKKESNYLNSQVTKLEKELGTLTRKQHTTEKKIEDAQIRIKKSEQRKVELKAELKQQHAALAQQLQAMHTAGEQSHLRLLLMQDKPSDISRNIQYFNYLNQYRSNKIGKLNETVQELKVVTENAEKEQIQLGKLQEELAVQTTGVKQKLDSRELALKKANSDLSSQRRKLNQLKSQEEALQREINRLAREAQKRHEAEEAARRKAEKKKQQARAATNNKSQRNTKPSKQKATPPPKQAAYKPGVAFSKLRGKLNWPTSGKVIYRYHTRRNEKQRWQGIVIAAPGGSKVRAVAAGRVIFSGWMKGYGHLIIVEHDRNYISLYGYNRAVFRKSGQRVKAGETIAAVGNSGGRKRNALYFEIRRKTIPQNPARWLR